MMRDMGSRMMAVRARSGRTDDSRGHEAQGPVLSAVAERDGVHHQVLETDALAAARLPRGDPATGSTLSGSTGSDRLARSAPRSRTDPSIGRRAFLSAGFGVLVSRSAAADLIGYEKSRTDVAGKPDEALIDANPILQRLRNEHPEALREVLERLRRPIAPARRAVEPPVPEAETAQSVLAENPDIAQLYRESPEAALDLIRLIREAAKPK